MATIDSTKDPLIGTLAEENYFKQVEHYRNSGLITPEKAEARIQKQINRQIDRKLLVEAGAGKVHANEGIAYFRRNQLPAILNLHPSLTQSGKDNIFKSLDNKWTNLQKKSLGDFAELHPDVARAMKERNIAVIQSPETIPQHNNKVKHLKQQALKTQAFLSSRLGGAGSVPASPQVGDLLSESDLLIYKDTVRGLKYNPDGILQLRENIVRNNPESEEDIPGYSAHVLSEVIANLPDGLSQEERGMLSFGLGSRDASPRGLRMMNNLSKYSAAEINSKLRSTADPDKYKNDFYDLDKEIMTSVAQHPNWSDYLAYRRSPRKSVTDLMGDEVKFHYKNIKAMMAERGVDSLGTIATEYLDVIFSDRLYFATAEGSLSISKDSFDYGEKGLSFVDVVDTFLGTSRSTGDFHVDSIGPGGKPILDMSEVAFDKIYAFSDLTHVPSAREDISTIFQGFTDSYLMKQKFDPMMFVFHPSSMATLASYYLTPLQGLMQRNIGDTDWDILLGGGVKLSDRLAGMSNEQRLGIVHHILATARFIPAGGEEDTFLIQVLNDSGIPETLVHQHTGAPIELKLNEIMETASPTDIERRLVSSWYPIVDALKRTAIMGMFPTSDTAVDFFQSGVNRVVNFIRIFNAKKSFAWGWSGLDETINTALAYKTIKVGDRTLRLHYITAGIYQDLLIQSKGEPDHDKLLKLAEDFTYTMRSANMNTLPLTLQAPDTRKELEEIFALLRNKRVGK